MDHLISSALHYLVVHSITVLLQCLKDHVTCTPTLEEIELWRIDMPKIIFECVKPTKGIDQTLRTVRKSSTKAVDMEQKKIDKFFNEGEKKKPIDKVVVAKILNWYFKQICLIAINEVNEF